MESSADQIGWQKVRVTDEGREEQRKPGSKTRDGLAALVPKL